MVIIVSYLLFVVYGYGTFPLFPATKHLAETKKYIFRMKELIDKNTRKHILVEFCSEIVEKNNKALFSSLQQFPHRFTFRFSPESLLNNSLSRQQMARYEKIFFLLIISIFLIYFWYWLLAGTNFFLALLNNSDGGILEKYPSFSWVS